MDDYPSYMSGQYYTFSGDNSESFITDRHASHGSFHVIPGDYYFYNQNYGDHPAKLTVYVNVNPQWNPSNVRQAYVGSFDLYFNSVIEDVGS